TRDIPLVLSRYAPSNGVSSSSLSNDHGAMGPPTQADFPHRARVGGAKVNGARPSATLLPAGAVVTDAPDFAPRSPHWKSCHPRIDRRVRDRRCNVESPAFGRLTNCRLRVRMPPLTGWQCSLHCFWRGVTLFCATLFAGVKQRRPRLA